MAKVMNKVLESGKQVKEMTEADMAKIGLDLSVESVTEWMDHFIHSVEENLRDLKRHREEFVTMNGRQPQGAIAGPIDILSWFVNDVNNGRMQGRLDMAVKHGADLAIAIKIAKRSGVI